MEAALEALRERAERLQPRHWAPPKNYGGSPVGCADAFGGPGCRPHRDGSAGATGSALGAPRPLRLLDLGTGSGCIAMTLAHELPACVVVGLEVSWQALEVARHNLLNHRLMSRVWLVQGDWTAPVGGGFDGILSNPPYVPSAQVEFLPIDVRQ